MTNQSINKQGVSCKAGSAAWTWHKVMDQCLQPTLASCDKQLSLGQTIAAIQVH